jgi:hypothetical protein
LPDKEELMSFIREITTPTGDTPGELWTPTNNMQDLWDFVVQYIYSLHTKGSNSIKDILTAVKKVRTALEKSTVNPFTLIKTYLA